MEGKGDIYFKNLFIRVTKCNFFSGEAEIGWLALYHPKTGSKSIVEGTCAEAYF